jgi:hypothetical protein
MRSERRNGNRMLMVALAGACMVLVLLGPQWRDELRAQVSCPITNATIAADGSATDNMETISCAGTPLMVRASHARLRSDARDRARMEAMENAKEECTDAGCPNLTFGPLFRAGKFSCSDDAATDPNTPFQVTLKYEAAEWFFSCRQ